MFDKKIFRDKAIERLAAPEDFDIPVKIISIKAWLFLAALFAVTSALVLWLVFSNLNQEAVCKGLIIKDDHLTQILAVKSGFVDNIFINSGSFIRKGELLVSLVSSQDKELLMVHDNNDKLAEDIKLRSAVSSPVDGSLFEIKVSQGDYVKTGDKLLSIEVKDTSASHNNFEITGFVPVNVINSVKEGANVLVSPGNIDVKEYGYLLCKVKRVAGYPVSQERKAMLAKENSLLENNMNDDIFEVTITPVLTNNGLTWSSSKTPAIKLINGTVCNVKIIINNKSFLSYIY